jgi:hypothetical protein
MKTVERASMSTSVTFHSDATCASIGDHVIHIHELLIVSSENDSRTSHRRA